MSKTCKKLLSVALAVLVLAAGFASTLTAFKSVSADAVYANTYDYTTLAEYDELVFDDFITTRGTQYKKFAENGIYAMNGIKIEGSVANRAGLKASDTFFSARWSASDANFKKQNTIGVAGDATEVKPYVVYAVEPGTAFSMEYHEYNDSNYNSANINGEGFIYDKLDLLVSADGVNFIPANATYNKVGVTDSYDKYVATLLNVGANTRYVKVQYPQNTDDVTATYVPQDCFVLNKVYCTTGTGLNNGEVSLKTTNADTSWVSHFLGSNAGVNYAITNNTGSDPTISAAGYNPYNYGGYSGKAWGYYSELQRTVAMKVQPGTRFTVRVQTAEHYFNQIRAALASQGKTGDDTLMEYLVYTSSGDNCWTLHRAAVQSINANGSEGSFGTAGFTTYTIDFIVPNNHCYVKIVSPLQGAGNKVEYYVDGQPSGTFTGDVGAVGNDLVKMQEVIYTPYNAETVPEITYNTSHTYAAISANLPSKNYIDNTNKWWTGYGAVAGQNHKGMLITTNKADLGIAVNNQYTITAGKENELNDDELPYLVYEVAGGTYFEIDTFIRKHTSSGAWNLGNHDANSLKGDFEFGIYTSDSLDGEWVQSGSLTFNCLTTMLDTDNYYTCTAYVPENAKYVKVVYGIRGRALYSDPKVGEDGYITGNSTVSGDGSSGWHGARFDDAVGLRGVRFTTNSTDHVTETYSDWHAGTAYYAEDGTTAKPATSPANTAYANSPSTVFIDRVQVDNHTRARYGMQISYAKHTTKPSVTYHVKSGSLFSALGGVGVDYHNERINATDSTKLDDFELEFYTAASKDATEWTLAYKTNTTTKEQVRFDIHNVSFDVPDNHNYVKIVFPNLGANAGGNVGNQEAMIYSVSYVPGSRVQAGAVSYDYTNLETYPESKSVAASPATYGMYSVYAASTSIWVTEGKLTSNGVTIGGKGVNPAYNNLNYAYDATKENPYVVYNVEPETIFSAELVATSNATIPWWSKETFKSITGEDFEMEVYVSDSVDGEWVLAATTKGATVSTVPVAFKVPANCKFVKVQYPQKGWIKTTISGNATEIRGNDLARLNKVSFVPYGTVTENDYGKGAVALENANKAQYGIYNFANVEGTAKGLVADDAGAYVTYKVGNGTALKVASADALKFAVSYDGVNFVNAKIMAKAGVYTVNVLDAKQYVKVYLDEGETITAVTADTLNPTATFINYTGKAVEIDTVEGTTPVAPEQAARVGYTFGGWDVELGAIYVDTTYVATYEKDADNTYTVALKEGSAGTIEYPENVTAATVRFDDRITITAPTAKDGLVFDMWVDETGCPISNSSKFSFLASGDLTIEAVYAESKTETGAFIYNSSVATVTENGDKWNMSVIWRVNAPATANITETGILFAATDLGIDANDKAECDAAWEAGIDAGTAKVLKHSTTAANKTLMYTVTNIKAAKDARYAIPYAVIDGEYVFGNVVSAN